jgi:hypothetical protein
MAYPVLQEKPVRDKKDIAAIYPAFVPRLNRPLALMGTRPFPPHQAIGF